MHFDVEIIDSEHSGNTGKVRGYFVCALVDVGTNDNVRHATCICPVEADGEADLE